MLLTFLVVCDDERDDIVKCDFVFQIIFLLFLVFEWLGNKKQVQD